MHGYFRPSLEIFGIKKTKKTGHDLPNSFAGKMLLHVDNFGDTCHSLVILTNINFDDDILVKILVRISPNILLGR